jgi:ankyrin repeat protein
MFYLPVNSEVTVTLKLKKSFPTIVGFALSAISFPSMGMGYIGFITPLMEAAEHADLKKMRYLIKQGASVNDVEGCDWPHAGKPVLRYAIDSRSLEAVYLLLENGANPNDITESPIINPNPLEKKANIRNLSLLSHAINSHAPIEIVIELIQYGAHLDGTPKVMGDWEPLMIASYRGNKEAVILLLKLGADVSAINNMDNKAALDYAKEMNHTQIVEILEAHSIRKPV